MKKVISSMLAAALTFSLTTSAFASENENNTINNQSSTNTVQLLTNNNVPLGTLTTTTNYHRDVQQDRVVVTIQTEKDYELNSDFANDPSYASSFVDTAHTTTIEVTNDEEYFIDGEQIPDSALNQELVPSIALRANDTGGVPKLGHYYSSGGTTNYYFATYSGMTMGGDADGNHVSRYTTRSNPYFSQAANTLDIVYGDHQSYLWSKATISAAVVAFPFTLASVVGAIADGGIIAVSAAQLYSHYKDVNSGLSKAYNLVSQM